MSRDFAIQDSRLSRSQRLAEQVAVRILDGTVVELEATDGIGSKDVRTGDAILFRVAWPVMVDGVTVIAAGTVATGVVTMTEKCGGHRLPSKISWHVKEVTAIDGRSIPLQLTVVSSGNEAIRTDERDMAAASLMFPGAPIALLFLSRQRESMVIQSGQRFRASVEGERKVIVPPRKG